MRPITYESADEFLADTLHPAFDCLVLDIELPGMSGLNLQKHLSAAGNAALSVGVHFFTYAVDLSLTGAEYWVGRRGNFASQASAPSAMTSYGRISMGQQRKTLIRRRDLLLAVTVSGAVVATRTASSPNPTELRRDKRKPQYQANSPEVQTFYRVNRYPVK
jgi:CheY-like chemotaxis protein